MTVYARSTLSSMALIAPALIVNRGVADLWEVVLEGERGAGTAASVLAGGTWRVRQELALDAAVRLAREAAGHVTEIRPGLTWAFAVGLPR